MARLLAPLTLCAAALTADLHSQTLIQIEGAFYGAPRSATGGGTLTETSQGRIRVTASEGTWTLMVVDVSVVDVPPSALEYAEWLALTTKYPWLVRQQAAVGATLGSAPHAAYLGNLVEAADLAVEAEKSLLVRPQDVRALVAACVNPPNHDPDAVRSVGQPVLAGQGSHVWKTVFELWGAAPQGAYWSQTYARPLESGELYEQVDWTRLMESAALTQTTIEDWLEFMRSGDVYVAASLGLHIHVQAISLSGNEQPPATPNPSTTPGIENVTPEKLARFKITQPVTIAIPFTPPLLGPGQIPHGPDVVNVNDSSGSLLAAIGRVTSATHAIFPGVDGPELSALLRSPDPAGPFAWIPIPPDAIAGAVTFADLDGDDESALIPIESFVWSPTDDTMGDE